MIENQMLGKRNLDEISVIRPILIILLILYHAFAPWCGGWEPIPGRSPNEAYWWIGKMAYSFLLPMFVFISGYVWSYQREFLQKKGKFRDLVIGKFKRLYVPSLLFSVAFFLFFHTDDYILTGGGSNRLIFNALHVMNGCGHMWFLPMLFWTFIFTYWLLLIKNRWIRWSIIIALNLFNLVPIPLRISDSFDYIIFFYAGYETLLWHANRKKSYSFWLIILSWLIFALLFVVLLNVNESVIGEFFHGGLIKTTIGSTISKINRNIYGIAGIVALLITTYNYITAKVLNNFTVKVGDYCFGVYLFHQFILMYIYYYTNIPCLLGTYRLPWVGFIITLCVSIILTYIFRLFRFGRFLIG